jgi:nucleoside-diphosphate-sugar epimerase
MTSLLQSHSVDVVISTLILSSPETSRAQLNLIAAASASSTVTTFLPSEYGIHYTEDTAPFHPAARYWLDAAAALRSSRLRFTRVVFGWTLDHYGLPRVKSYMKPFRYVLDFEGRRAAVPGDGSQKVSFLHTADLARYVCALLEAEGPWPEVSAFVGGVVSWGEFVRLAERVTGMFMHPARYLFFRSSQRLSVWNQLTGCRRGVGCAL